MTRLDLNAKRAARAAARGEEMTVVLGTQEFALPAELPLAVLERIDGNDFVGAVKLIVGDGQWERFTAQAPTMDDIMDIVECYGVSLGESAASLVSSMSTGAPSKPTSRASTDEILPIRVGVPPQ